ncbi:TetR family transcriptional regulator [Streptomyces violascens]|uniref:TetR family transcriptional regulator n=1 Tax=Streptomyces violascens TaxID=67381 RepID=UPI0036615C0C
MLKQDRSRRTHEVLLDAAAGEFVRHGYAGANLNRIADQVGMSKGALYAHFSSKEDLAGALTKPFDQAWRGLLEEADAVRSDPLGALQCLTFGLAGRLRIDIRFRAGLHLVSEGARAHGEVPTLIDDMTRATTRLVRQAQQQGELKPTHAPEALSSFVVASTFGMYHTMSQQRLDDFLHEARRIWQLVFSSAAACPATPLPRGATVGAPLG